MSSAILYVAIVAIWIGVLVPRWLRHENSHSGQVGLRRLSRHFGAARETDETAQLYTADAPPSPPSPVQSYGWSAEEVTQQERLIKSPDSGSADEDAPGAAPAAPGMDENARPARPGLDHAANRVRRPPTPYDHDDADEAERRDRIMLGRRRMLWLLLVLTAVGIGLAYLQLAAWWVMIPPALLLGGYLLLLREAAHADAEARERHDLARAAVPARAQAQAHASETRGRAAATAAPPAYVTGPHADIIDLSEHVEDQLYDQYTDAKLRAVGD